MAVNKAVNTSAKSHGAMKNCIEYVLKEQKTTDGLVAVTGPFTSENITVEAVYQAFLDEKRIWNKDSGRMYAHNIISFHKDEEIKPAEALEFGCEFAEKWFPNHQTLISVHQDKDHTHIHMVTNSVSFADGLKLHSTANDLARMKELTNQMCKERGLSVAQKGRHFDGSIMERGEVVAWNKNKYNLLLKDASKSYQVSCAKAVLLSLENCCSKKHFVRNMSERGWSVHWDDNRKYITFEDTSGNKVRDKKVRQITSTDISKEGLLNEFIRQQQLLDERKRREGRNTTAFIRDIESQDRNVQASENQSIAAKEQRRAEERQRTEAKERAAKTRSVPSRGHRR